MSHGQEDHGSAPFIPAELRPDLSGYFDGYPPVAPDADGDAVKRAAGDVLGARSMQALGLSEMWFTRAMWNERLVRDPDVTWTVADDGQAVLLHLERGTYFSLSPQGTALWDALGTGATANDLLRALRQRYGLPDERVAPALEAFLATLVQRALVTTEALAPDVGAADLPVATDAWPAELGEMELSEHGDLAEITNQSKIKEKEKEKEKDGDKKDIF